MSCVSEHPAVAQHTVQELGVGVCVATISCTLTSPASPTAPLLTKLSLGAILSILSVPGCVVSSSVKVYVSGACICFRLCGCGRDKPSLFALLAYPCRRSVLFPAVLAQSTCSACLSLPQIFTVNVRTSGVSERPPAAHSAARQLGHCVGEGYNR